MCKLNYASTVRRIMPDRAAARARNGGIFSIIFADNFRVTADIVGLTWSADWYIIILTLRRPLDSGDDDERQHGCQKRGPPSAPRLARLARRM